MYRGPADPRVPELYRAEQRPATYRWYLHFLESFGSHVGKTLLVADLHLSHVNGWLAKHYPAKGNTNTRHNAIACLKRLFNWATKEMEYFDRNPLAALKKPPRTHRDTCPTREQWDRVMTEYKPADPFYDFLTVIRATGCRPQEMRVMAAPHGLRCRGHSLRGWRDPGQEVRPRRDPPPSRRRRVEAAGACDPEGPLFRNENGKPWRRDAVSCRFQRLQRKVKFRINCYSARHSKATDMLENGGSAGAVASLLGHRDPTVVLKFYGKHIEQRSEHLRGLMNGTGPSRHEADENPHGLKVIGEPQPEPKPEPKPKPGKKDAG